MYVIVYDFGTSSLKTCLFDSAFATFLYDTRKGKEGWNEDLVKMYGVVPEHLPAIVECTDLVGGLVEEAARDLGLAVGTPV